MEVQANYKTIQTVHADKTRKQKHLKSQRLGVCWGKNVWFCCLLLLFAAEAFKLGRPEEEAMIRAAEGAVAVTPPFVDRDCFLCGGLMIVFFSQPPLQMLMFILCQCSYFITTVNYYLNLSNATGKGAHSTKGAAVLGWCWCAAGVCRGMGVAPRGCGQQGTSWGGSWGGSASTQCSGVAFQVSTAQMPAFYRRL